MAYFFEGLSADPVDEDTDGRPYVFERDATELVASYHGISAEERAEIFTRTAERGKPDPGKLN